MALTYGPCKSLKTWARVCGSKLTLCETGPRYGAKLVFLPKGSGNSKVENAGYQSYARPSRVALNAFIGFIVGLAGGLVGLGGAELRLPYLAGTLRLPLKTAIPVNLAVSLLTLLAALPTRLYTLKTTSLVPFLYETTALGIGAILGAYAGVSGFRRLSPEALRRSVFAVSRRNRSLPSMRGTLPRFHKKQ